ncbi:hypothetical protein ACO22_00265 [Paracoccidioides brasiliensis]|uniref:Protein kinase domain-containing protein n=1 Tax=Paracoccidioides brasiliensis TaxID=121759 RepID=A0A1D2JPW7_PARBR|nr:hypothetical protein ACO22_00265 [Paracoccidioides brasiliensis]
MPAIVFEIWTALAARSEHIAALNGSKHVIMTLCPVFYGFMLAIDIANYTPHLDAFRHDAGLPSSILIEHLPKPLVMNCVTYSKERMQRAVIGIQQVHSAFIEHNDPYPKNILIVPGHLERVVWVDLDVAIVYPNDIYIGKNGRSRIEFETEVVKSFGQLLEEDQEEGPPPKHKILLGMTPSSVHRHTPKDKIMEAASHCLLCLIERRHLDLPGCRHSGLIR